MRVQRRRGISYILEVVMMTLVITALAGVVLTWGLSQVSSSRLAITAAVNARIDRMQEGIIIEDVQMLDTSHLRIYVRNTGSIQAVVDAAYANNVNTVIFGVCPTGSFQSGTVTTAALGNYVVTFTTAEPSSGYTVTLTPSWSGAPVPSVVAGQSTTTFTLNIATAKAGTINWSTNYAYAPGCPSGTKLSLSINGVGAIDVTVPSAVNTTCSPTPPICPGTTYTVTASTNKGTTATGSYTV